MTAAAPTKSVSSGVVTEDRPPRSYQDRKEQGWCTYGRCAARAEDGYQFCAPHRSRRNKRQAKAQSKRRSDLYAAGKCTRCRKPSKTFRCPRCRILDRTTLPTRSDAAGVVTGDQWRRDNDGWQRYRGKGRRGPPAQSVNDDQDLQTAAQSLERGRHALAYAHSAGVRAVSREAQRDARAAAASILLMAAGFVREVAQRNLSPDQTAVGLRGRVREALGDGIDPEMVDDAMIDRVIDAVRGGAVTRGRR